VPFNRDRLDCASFRRRDNPVRIAIIQPRVARNELPWVIGAVISSTLKELNRKIQTRIIPPWPNHWRKYWSTPYFQPKTAVRFSATSFCVTRCTDTLGNSDQAGLPAHYRWVGLIQLFQSRFYMGHSNPGWLVPRDPGLNGPIPSGLAFGPARKCPNYTRRQDVAVFSYDRLCDLGAPGSTAAHACQSRRFATCFHHFVSA